MKTANLTLLLHILFINTSSLSSKNLFLGSCFDPSAIPKFDEDWKSNRHEFQVDYKAKGLGVVLGIYNQIGSTLLYSIIIDGRDNKNSKFTRADGSSICEFPLKTNQYDWVDYTFIVKSKTFVLYVNSKEIKNCPITEWSITQSSLGVSKTSSLDLKICELKVGPVLLEAMNGGFNKR